MAERRHINPQEYVLRIALAAAGLFAIGGLGEVYIQNVLARGNNSISIGGDGGGGDSKPTATQKSTETPTLIPVGQTPGPTLEPDIATGVALAATHQAITPDITVTGFDGATVTATATVRPTVKFTPTERPTSTPSQTENSKPDYSECGPNPVLYDQIPFNKYPKGLDGKGLPTAVSLSPDIHSQYFTLTQVNGCLTGVEGITESNVLNMTIGFYDVLGNYHPYPTVMGGQNTNGSDKRFSICQTSGGAATCNSMLSSDALETLRGAVANPGTTRQVPVTLVKNDLNAPWNLGQFFPGEDFMTKLYSAIKTGTNFPPIPDGKKLVAWDLTIISKN